MASNNQVMPFTAHVDDRDIDALRQRLQHTRWPEAETAHGWDQGVPIGYARELAEYWRSDYDWRKAEARLNQWPQHLVDLSLNGQEYRIHCVHRRSSQANARVLLLTHGWPGSIFEFVEVIDALAEPLLHGGQVDDAFHVIVPSLPGYGFSSKPATHGTSIEAIADLWDALMNALGYDEYYAQGGDWGSQVTCALAQRHAPRCRGIHLNMVVAPPDPDTLGDLQPGEERALAALDHYRRWDAGYSKIQSTRPQTLGYALADSPIGQMTWIVEKFWAWTDCEREGVKHPENVLSRDAMLDTVSLYWFSNSAASSARLYWESFNSPNLEPVPIPMGGSSFPKDIFLSSERWARRRFPGMVYWSEPELGGHFAALEQPAVFTRELRDCFRRMRSGG